MSLAIFSSFFFWNRLRQKYITSDKQFHCPQLHSMGHTIVMTLMWPLWSISVAEYKNIFFYKFNSAEKYIRLSLLVSMRHISAKNCCQPLLDLSRLIDFHKSFYHQRNV